ncbi:MAG: TIGR01777 family oxidoreductase, partial [Limisphaerales bacterium]
VVWDVQTGKVDAGAMERWGGPEVFIHLAGENIAARRWSPEQKKRIRDSRVEATKRLAESLSREAPKLRVFIGASAVGFYGDRGDEILTEQSARGEGFLAETCEGWEAAAQPLREANVRVVHLRFGMILSGEGGALTKMLPFFRAGLGGRVGTGEQWVSWIALEDAVRLIEFALQNESVRGAYNAVAPEPVRNREFTSQLAQALKRPAFLPVPGLALRLLYGEMADALLLSSQRVMPERLQQATGFIFRHPELSKALREVLYRN